MRRILAIGLLALAACHGDDEGAAATSCGDGIAGGGESCDGADLRGLTCASLGLPGGTLACLPACVLDVRGCGAAVATPDAGVPDTGAPDAGGAAPLVFDDRGHAELPDRIRLAGEVDAFSVAIPTGQTGNLRVAIPRGAAPCAQLRFDLVVAPSWIIAGQTPLFPFGPDCGELNARGVPAGVATLHIRAVTPARYAISAELVLQPCGDGVIQDGQECDGGAGCSARCVLEERAEREPDDQIVAAAGPYAAPFAFAGSVDRAPLDDDWIAIRIDQPSTLAVRLDGLTDPLCSDVALYSLSGGEPQVVPALPIGCGSIDTLPPGVAAGTFYLRVSNTAAAGTRYRVRVMTPSVCGNGVVEPPETCDGSPGCEGCSISAECGDGAVDSREECDDGNREPGDCCDDRCAVEPGCEREPNDGPGMPSPAAVPTVLRGVLGAGDVDNFFLYVPPTPSADLVLSTCAATPGLSVGFFDPVSFTFHSATAGDDGCLSLGYTVPGEAFLDLHLEGPEGPYAVDAAFLSVCGDGVVAGTEGCDDDAACVSRGCDRAPICGDGIATSPETCDDGARGGCPEGCGVAPVCGDHNVDPGEECDDGNTARGDGCGPDCRVEPPPACGDGFRDAGEACDDGDLEDGDGCDSSCAVEAGHHFEVEPNDDGRVAVAEDDFRAAAAEGPLAAPLLIHGALAPAGDEDVFAVRNSGTQVATVVAETFAPDPGVCDADTVLRARDAGGALLAVDDDAGTGACARLAVSVAAGQTVYLQVSDAGDNSVITAYVLELSIL